MTTRSQLTQIARGGPFDVLDAIRLIAQHLTADPETPADAKTVALLLNSRLADILAKAGYLTVADIAAATDYELSEIDGVGPKTVAFIRTRIPPARAQAESGLIPDDLPKIYEA